jgi:hypothetical protein
MLAAKSQAGAGKAPREADEGTVKMLADENEQLKLQIHEQEERCAYFFAFVHSCCIHKTHACAGFSFVEHIQKCFSMSLFALSLSLSLSLSLPLFLECSFLRKGA